MTEQVMGGKLIGAAVSALTTMIEIPGGGFLMGSESLVRARAVGSDGCCRAAGLL